MKATLLIFVAVALVGCASPDLDNPQTLQRILAEAQVGAGVKTGWRKIAHANGKVSSLSHFKDGELDGLQTGWHENGKKRVQCRYKDGEKDGLWTVWDENGRTGRNHNLPVHAFRAKLSTP